MSLVVLYKNYAARKNHWKRSLILQILVPFGALLTLWILLSNYGCQPLDDDKVEYSRMWSNNDSYYDGGQILYAPASNFTGDLLKRMVDNCLRPPLRYNRYSYNYDRYNYQPAIELRGFVDEGALMRAYRNASTDQQRQRNGNIVSVLIDNYDRATQRLEYRLRVADLYPASLRSEEYNSEYYWKSSSRVAAIQGCLDQQFVQMNAREPDKARFNVTLQAMPRLLRNENNDPYDFTTCNYIRRVFRLINGLSVLIFLLPLLVDVFAWSRDQKYGSSILLSNNRLCSGLDLLTSYTSSILLLCLLLVIPATLLFTVSSSQTQPLIVNSSPLVIGAMTSLYIAHLFSFGLFASSLFANPWLAMLATISASVGSMALPVLYSPYEGDSPILRSLPYLGALFPNVLWFLELNEFNHKEFFVEGANWDDVFNVGQLGYGFAGSLGMLMVISGLGTISYLCLALIANRLGCRRRDSLAKNQQVGNDCESTAMAGRSGKDRIERPSVQQSTPAVQIRNLNVSSLKEHSGQGISIDFYRGEIISLVDFDGAYKTRLLSTLCGLRNIPKDAIKINSLSMECHADRIVNDIGFHVGADLIMPNLTVYENLKFFAKLKRNMRAKSNVEQDIACALDKFQLFNRRHELACNLNADLRRQLCVAMALVANTDIVVLDEPTKDLDADAKRVIWDNIRELRGLKTIIIGTKSMKEAELVSDRIAVMVENRIDSYGTPTFLRQALRTESSELGVIFDHDGEIDKEKIVTLLQHPRTRARRENERELELSVPDTPETKKALENLEQVKAELGVTSFTILYPSLEDMIFTINPEELDFIDVKSPLDKENVPVGNETYNNAAYAAMKSKKLAYIKSNPRALTIVFALIMAAVVYLSFVFLQGRVVELSPRIVRFRPDLYRDSRAYYGRNSSHNEALARAYESASRQWRTEKTVEVVNSSLSAALVNEARAHKTTYQTRTVAAAEFNESTNGNTSSFLANALYSRSLVYSLPISLNLMGNALAKALVGNESSIAASVQAYPSTARSYYWFRDGSLYGIGCAMGVTLLFVLVSAVYFLRQPADERQRGLRHQQRMANASPLAYWRSLFFYDFAVWMSLAALLLVSLVAVDKLIGAGIFKSVDIILLELFLFALYAFNVLPLVYLISFIPLKRRKLTRFAIFILLGMSLLLIVIAIGMTSWERYSYNLFAFLYPFYNFYFSQRGVFKAIAQENRCEAARRSGELQCGSSGNYDYTCCNGRKAFARFWSSSDRHEDGAISVAYLAFVPVVYVCALLLLDSRLLEKTVHLLKVVRSGLMPPMLANNDRMQKEKSLIANKIAQMNNSIYTFVSDKQSASLGVLSAPASSPPATQEQQQQQQQQQQQATSEMLLVHELRKATLHKFVLYDASFRVERGECFGLYGLKGAGKTSLLELVAGASFTNYGYLYLDGVDLLNGYGGVKGRVKARQALSRLGYCPAKSFLLDSLSASEHLQMFARLRSVPDELVDSEAHFWLKTMGLSDVASAPSSALSCGKKRRLMLAATLVGNPKMIVLDEPTAGVDPETRRFIWRLIRSLRASGKTVLMATSSSREAEALCDRIGVLLNGTLVDFETPRTLASNKHVRL